MVTGCLDALIMTGSLLSCLLCVHTTLVHLLSLGAFLGLKNLKKKKKMVRHWTENLWKKPPKPQKGLFLKDLEKARTIRQDPFKDHHKHLALWNQDVKR